MLRTRLWILWWALGVVWPGRGADHNLQPLVGFFSKVYPETPSFQDARLPPVSHEADGTDLSRL